MDQQRERLRLLALICLIAGACVLGDLLIAVCGFSPSKYTSGNQIYLGFAIGFHFAQVVLISILTVMSPLRLLTRIAGGAFAMLVVGSSIAAFTRFARPGIPPIFFGIVCLQWVIYQIPLWPIRRTGWRLDRHHTTQRRRPADTIDVEETQFALKQIFFWTTVSAVVVAIARFLLPMIQFQLDFDVQDWSIFSILAIGNALSVLPLMWGTFVTQRWREWLFGSLAWAAACGGLEMVLMAFIMPNASNELPTFIAINVYQLLFSVCLLNAIRWLGLRWSRETSA